MTQSQKIELKELAEDIRKMNYNFEESKFAVEKQNNKYKEFIEVFHSEKKGWFLIMGILCLAALIFDFWVSEKSMLYLSQIIRIKVEFLAFLFSLIDGGIAILASGGLAGNDLIKKRKMKRAWLPVLLILAVVKIILFILLIYSSYYFRNAYGEIAIQIGTFDMLKIIIPQVFFIIVIYSILAKAGFGLWYIIGSTWFGIWSFVLTNPQIEEKKIVEKCNDFKLQANHYEVDPIEISKEFEIKDIYCQYIDKDEK